MVYKRFLAGILSSLLMTPSSGVYVLAETKATMSDFTVTSDMIGGDLIVTIPDSIPLTKSGDNFIGSGTVTAYGTASPSSVLTVWTNSETTYKNQYKQDITVNADVTFGTDGTVQWTASELRDNITADPKLGYEVTAVVPFDEIEYIGEYKTNILFNIALGSSTGVSTTYYMGYDYTDSSLVSYDNQNDIDYDILPQADTVAELKEFSTDKEAIENKGYDVVIESSDSSLIIPSNLEGYDVVGVSFDTFFANEDIALYVSEVEVPSSVTGVELSDTTSSASRTVITCDNVRRAVNLSKKLPESAKIRFKFESNGERDYTEFFAYDSDSRGTYVKGFSEYGYETLKSYGADATVEINLPVTYQGKPVVGIEIVGYADDFTDALTDEDMPDQVWILPDSYTFCSGFWNNDKFKNGNPCTKLTGIIFNDNITKIQSDAFRYCDGLTSVVIPASVTEIGSMAFAYCTNLTNVTFEDGFNGTIENNAFWNTGIMEVTLPSSITSLNGFAFGNDELSAGYNVGVKRVFWNNTSDMVTVTNPTGFQYTTVVMNDGRFIGVGTNAVLATAQSDDAINAIVSFDVPDDAFSGNEGKSYSTITITNAVTSIGKTAFRKSTATINADLRNVTSLGQNAFSFTNIDTIVMKDTLFTKYALSYANIKNLYIEYTGSDVSLVAYATSNATFENVYFSGTKEQYEAFIGSANNNALKIDDGTINIVYNASMP